MLLILLCSFLFPTPTPGPQTGVVVDATTSHPLAGVEVRRLDAPEPAVQITDEAGRFIFPTTSVRLRLNRLGYAPLEITRRQATPGSPTDTIRLLPKDIVLGEVSVRPGKIITLTTLPKTGSNLGRGLMPDQAVGMLLMPPAGASAGQVCVISQVRLYLANRPKEGRLRIRLVNVVSGLGADTTSRPGAADLIPEAAVFSHAQLRDASRGIITLDLAKYNLLMPPSGVCVLVECLTTNPMDQVVSTIIPPPNSSGKRYVVLAPLANREATRQVDANDFPVLKGKFATSECPTWSRNPPKFHWWRRKGLYSNVRVELSVYGY
jgi:hypothetical protein